MRIRKKHCRFTRRIRINTEMMTFNFLFWGTGSDRQVPGFSIDF